MNSHVNTSKSNSHQQDAGSRRGGGGGGGSEDIKKKMKMERSIIAAELDSLQGFKDPRPNYMKPTSSSNARTEVSNPKPSKPSKKTASKGTTARPSTKKSLKGVVVVSRATCSSTLKGSMFPKALDLAPGGTEAEGTSAIRVCPYTYCSLNGHRHEPLPPLRCFVSARRRLLKTQKRTKLRVLSSFKVKGLKEEEEMLKIDTGQEALARCSSTEQVPNDFFVEIYTTKPKEKNKPELHVDGELGEEGHPNDSYSDEDVDVEMNFLEYVECDRRVEKEDDADENDTLSLVQVGSGELHTESCCEVDVYGEGKTETEKATEIEQSEHSEEGFGLPRQVTQEAEDDELMREVDATEEVALPTEDTRKNDIAEDDGPEVQEILVDESTQEEDWAEEVEDASSLSIAHLFDSCDNLSELEQAAAEGDRVRDFNVISPDDVQNCAYDGQSEKEHQEKSFNLEESIDETKARMRITSRKKMSEDLEETKEFNPRGPRFLPAEPDPEAEKVDLRHQMMDERKNSEEWMIDYALRRAVMKLAPAPKKKVAVLVEAFETVAPLPAWGKPRRHSTPGFSHARIIQACS
ncbi:uncharacterized protein M6B38_102515 [Iris pallida]|nr:uncharacterized protein M6B38_102515 [Iris pallida]